MNLKHICMPRVRRVEYLLDFLSVVEGGYSRKRAQEKLAERKRAFEIEKSKALGRGRPFMEKLMRTESLMDDCQVLSTRLGLVRILGKHKLELTQNGMLLLNTNNTEKRKIIVNGLLETYSAFVHFLLTIAAVPQVEVDLPMKKDNKFFIQESRRYGFEISQTDFEVICDLASELDLVNWFPFSTDAGRYKRVYLASVLYYDEPKKMNETEESHLYHFDYGGKSYWLGPRNVEKDEFKRTLWEEYLKLTKYIPRRPVFYSQLRSNVCYKSRVSDSSFDTFLAEIMISDRNYRLVGSGGSLPYSHDAASLLKSIPLKNERGEYIVYLKMDMKEGL